MASLTAWEAALPLIRAAATVPVVEANRELDTPDAETWLHVAGRAGASEAAEMAAQPVWAEDGAIEVSIFARLGGGTLAARREADRIATAFRLAPPGPVRWAGWQLDEGQTAEDGTHFVLVLTLRYRRHSAAIA